MRKVTRKAMTQNMITATVTLRMDLSNCFQVHPTLFCQLKFVAHLPLSCNYPVGIYEAFGSPGVKCIMDYSRLQNVLHPRLHKNYL